MTSTDLPIHPSPQLFGRLPAPLKAPTPFKVSIPDSELQDFKTLLRLSKIPSPTYETLQTDRKYGLSHEWMTTAKAQWLDGFDWRKCEAHINSFPAFISKVELEVEGNPKKEEYNIHWTGLLSDKEDAVPILLLHGWPGSFLEFLPLMTLFRKQYTPQTLPYHLIATSMPGYSFSSSAPLNREFGIYDVPRIFNQLMHDLGFGSGYVAQGGDIGSRISRLLAVQFEEVKAVHLNFCPVQQPPDSNEESLSPKEKEGIARAKTFMNQGRGYSNMHATRPGTVSLLLGSNPLATLAWIGEKYLEWSDVDPELDTILEVAMLYWLTESGGKSVYPYRQKLPSGKTPSEVPEQFYIKQPMGCSYFPKELVPFPREWCATTGNLVFYREKDKGGHFAALEQPELLKRDLEDFVEQVWKK